MRKNARIKSLLLELRESVPNECMLVFQAAYSGSSSLMIVDCETWEILYCVDDLPIDGGDPGTIHINGKEYLDHLRGREREEWLKRVMQENDR